MSAGERSMNEPKITVIIPTRERCDVLEKSLKTVTAQNYDTLEIIVSDNFSGDATEQIVRSANDSRVRYINTGKRVSMSHNWEFALSHVTDGWVTIIGDDDGLLPGALATISKIMQSTDVEAIRSSPCSYSWPSFIDKEHGRLAVSLKSGGETRDGSAWLSRAMNGNAHNAYAELPMLYTGGWVKASVLEKIRKSDGTIYQSRIPDVYSAVAIAGVIGKYLYLNEPFALSGVSENSSGGSPSGRKKFLAESNIPFHKDMPLRSDGSLPSSVQAFVYESYLQSDFLRPPDKVCIRAQQLKLILATASGSFRSEAREWGKKYATSNGLNFERIESGARRARRYIALRTFVALTQRAIYGYIISSPDVPIKDVYEASIAAAVILKIRPGPLQRIRRMSMRAVEKYIKV
jgi:glycosyltransferase involved in cell wall biosynthesis